MKFNIKYITFSALLCASMVSCDLDVVPPSDISTETFWKNEKDAWNGLNALRSKLESYIPLRGLQFQFFQIVNRVIGKVSLNLESCKHNRRDIATLPHLLRRNFQKAFISS